MRSLQELTNSCDQPKAGTAWSAKAGAARSRYVIYNLKMENGQIEAIWIKRCKRGPMDAVAQAEMIAGKGLVGNANQGGRRQVSIIDAAVWERIMDELGATIDPSARRANIMVRGLELANTRKRILLLDECRVKIFTETKPCERMDEVLPGLKAALYKNWAGGASGQVITGGTVRIGAVARWED